VTALVQCGRVVCASMGRAVAVSALDRASLHTLVERLWQSLTRVREDRAALAL